MSWLSRLAHRVADTLVRSRSRLPKPLNRLIDDVAKNPDGFAGRLASRVLGSSAKGPAPTSIPATPIRVYIGPTNYSGQGHLWARALERADAAIGARNMAVDLPGGFAFEADTTVPIAVYNRSASWQRAEFEAVTGFTHVLIEAERPLFGSLFSRDVSREIAELRSSGLSVALLSHGTDIRSPRRHTTMTQWSPFPDDAEQTAALQSDADANLSLIESAGLPVFVSTPDLLVDLPSASWCPVVIDLPRWSVGRGLLEGSTPVIAHIPSMGSVKGTHLIEQPMRALERHGLVEYRQLTGIASVEMPLHVGDADIVLDQFRLGSYGVAACEAMAAGRAVVGHILPSVREHIVQLTGHALPVVEATPATIADVVRDLVGDPGRVRRLGADGRRFVEAVHSGAMSAQVLRSKWLDSAG